MAGHVAGGKCNSSPDYGEALTRTAQRIHDAEMTADKNCYDAMDHDMIQFEHGRAEGFKKANEILQEEYQAEFSGIPVDIVR